MVKERPEQDIDYVTLQFEELMEEGFLSDDNEATAGYERANKMLVRFVLGTKTAI